MPLLEITQTRHVNASVRFTDATARLVDQYVTFLRSHGQPRATADDVIEQGVGYIFNKDREFQEYLEDATGGQCHADPAIRKAPASDAVEQASKEACCGDAARSTNPGCSGRIEGMILHPNPGQGHYGAAHRKNVDTPSLKGLRWEPIWFQRETCRKQAACRRGQIRAVPLGTAPEAGLRRISDAFTDL